MRRKTFLTMSSITVLLVGCFALAAPEVLLTNVKHAAPSEAANVMARTVGVLLVSVGVLNFLIRDHEDSPTLRAILIANFLLQLGILPIDPIAYASGAFRSLGSFVPNTVLHVLLAFGFIFYLRKMKPALRVQPSAP